MFPGALNKVKINHNDYNVHIRSDDSFRQNCSLLRRQIINYAELMDPKTKILNLCKFGEDAKSVLQAVMDSDDLVKATDLTAISNRRLLIQANEKFRKIMS